MAIYKLSYEFTLRCEVLKILEEKSPYITLLICREISTDRILLVAKENSVEKFDASLLEELEKKLPEKTESSSTENTE